MRFEFEREHSLLTFWVCKYFGICFSWMYWRHLFDNGMVEFLGLYIQPCSGVLGIGIFNFIFGIRWLT